MFLETNATLEYIVGILHTIYHRMITIEFGMNKEPSFADSEQSSTMQSP